MKRLIALFILAVMAMSCHQPQITDQSIDKAVTEGNFTMAEQMIKMKIATQELTPAQKWDLDAKVQKMHRIRQDFTKDDTTVLAYIKNIIPDVTPEQITHWERVNGIQPGDLDEFFSTHIPAVVAQTKKGQIEHLSKPQRMRITYTITVKPNEVPEGETIRVWMPFPRENKRSSNIKLLSTTNKNYIIAPDEYAHKSIYMETPAIKDSAMLFGYQLEVETADHWFNFGPEDVKPYNTESELYKKYTAERTTHVIFTPQLKQITDSLIAGETNPYNKARRIFDYIARNIPWASAREYATFDNIPEYVLKNKHGDCGQVGLTFIAMARYAGIPAKWQSGFVAHPGMGGMHDWSEIYFEGIGWVPVDASFGLVPNDNDKIHHFYLGGIDSHRYYVNEDFSGNFFPAKSHLRSEPVDFQRGEVEWKAENLYFGRWRWKINVEYL